jgi:hypothetical protein
MGSEVDVLDGLVFLEETDFPAYYSPGAKERALELAEIAKNCVHYLDEFFKNKVQNRLLVLNREDWEKRVKYPYGQIAGINNYLWYPEVKENNPIFKELAPFYENISTDLRIEHTKLLSESDGPFPYSLLRWFEMLMVHEFCHNYNRENGVLIELKWFDELFCDYLTYAFLKRNEKENPNDLRLFELLSKILYNGGHGIVEHTSIEDFERLYVDVGGANYCWYHGWFNLGVMDLYKMYGERFIENVIVLYQSEAGFDSTSEKLASRLDERCDGFLDWYRLWVRQE